MEVPSTIDAGSGYIMYAKTVQACVLKVLMDSLSSLLVDTTLQFSADGVKLIELDNTHIVMIHVRLDARKFEEFYCETPVNIGVNIGNLHTLLKTVNSSDTLTLFLSNDDRNRLGIRVENEEKKTSTEFKLNLLDLDAHEYTIPPVAFSAVTVLPSTYFQKIVRDMSYLSDRVEIKNIGRQLILSCSGNFCQQETILRDTDEPDVPDDEGEEERDPTVINQGVFSLKYLVMFTKCSSLNPNISLFIRSEFPCICMYDMSLGSVRLCLSPFTSEEDQY
jgi:proliferating cell nuclear antigen